MMVPVKDSYLNEANELINVLHGKQAKKSDPLPVKWSN